MTWLLQSRPANADRWSFVPCALFLTVVSSRTRRRLIALLACLSCARGDGPRIGVGVPITGVNDVLAAASARLEDLPPDRRPAVDKWTVEGPTVLETVWQQATLFSQDERIIGVVGHTGSRDALLAAAVYNASRVPHIVPTATASRLTDVGPWTFVMVPDNLAEGRFLAEHAVDTLRAQRLTVFYVGDEYGAELRNGIRDALRSRVGVHADMVLVPSGACDRTRVETYQAIVAGALRRSHPDVVILATGVLGAECILPALAERAPGIPVLGADGVDLHSPQLRALPESALRTLRSVVFWTPGNDSIQQRFAATAARTLPYEPGPFDAMFYDSFALMATAIAEAGPDRAAVRDWLLSLGRTRPAWRGVTGPVTFDGQRRRLPMSVERYRVTPAAVTP